MYSDITTPENQRKAIKAYRKYLRAELKAAISIYNRLDENDRTRALKAVNKINRIRHHIYEKALELGYVERCVNSISACKGECCKWHFPKNLDCLDLFVTVCSISPEKQTALQNQIAFNNGKYQCPVLRENGCLLSFDSRPLICSNAYPCFSKESYHNFLEKQQKDIEAQLTFLKSAFKRHLGNEYIKNNAACIF